MKAVKTPSLFDGGRLEADEGQVSSRAGKEGEAVPPRHFIFKPEQCPHTKEEKTFTVWKEGDAERMTWTCLLCGQVRGRCDNR